ncbi:GLPGLI family protein [Taibaiella chishuiensis]|uniref:GLPGLI family protein n=1 Tax=Taibaiella chishuiensis TaxID=1434707 RepID=A0A2P8CVV9_9BACT|nr:GLPGLI family protein [Taibaiella chishuiensis]PSK89112.1 GLPGLI family protein [Taibaiella chishuiensis]
MTRPLLRYTSLLLLLYALYASPAAAQMIVNGTIKFERKTNLHQQVRVEQGNSAAQMPGRQSLLNNIPQYNIAYFNYHFTAKESKYAFEKKDAVNYDPYNMTGLAAKENIVYSNFITKKTVSKKLAYDTDYLVADSMKQYTWKISDEVRTIAGYLCRKATTQINDSVVVVAFYSTQIMVSGGPESFNGLPGLILGIAIPRLYTTWFATSVEILQQGEIQPPDKGRRVDNAGFRKVFLDNTPAMNKNATMQSWWMSL